VAPPGVNGVADHATKGGDDAASWLTTLTPNTWKIIIIAVIALVILWAWRSFPAFKWMIIGCGLAALVFLVFIA
jgi:hypothetical protein